MKNMKELSIEQKAKAYDERLEKAQKWYDINTNEGYRSIFEDIFPELKESEDERIRKELIEFFTFEHWDGEAPFSVESARERIAWLEKQGEQKPADKVEPKFHEGDWIIHQGTENIYQVVAVINNQYQLKYGDNYTIQNCADVDRCARLWDITKDAKDGDVLEFGDHGRLVVGIVSYVNKTTGKVDVNCLLENNNFKVGNYYNLDTIKPHPAAKEQHDLLFQKMKEAGYEWDAEKKELKKAEQKPMNEKSLYKAGYLDGFEDGVRDAIIKEDEQKVAWSEEDEPQKELAETYLAVFDKKFPILPTLNGKQLADYKNFLNKCQQILGLKYWGLRPLQAKLFGKLSLLWAAWGAEHLKGLGQTDGDTDNEKQEWSEEDEDILNTIINHFKVDIECTDEDDIVRWLKSFKDRVQPKQKWSEEDEKMIEICVGALRYSCYSIPSVEKAVNWLKSLRPQNSVTDEELAQAKKEAYNDALDKIEYHSGEPTFDDGWSAAIWYLKKRTTQPQNTWKPSDEQMDALRYVTNFDYGGHKATLVSLYEQLKKLKG